MRNLLRGLFATALAVAAALPVAAADTVEAIRARGQLACGVSPDVVGFAVRGSGGAWSGFDVDYCRAVASVVLGDPGRLRLVPVATAERFAALERGEIDLLTGNTTWTLEREAGNRVAFAAITYFDGQGFMLRADLGVRRFQQMDGLKVCVESGTTTEQNLVDQARAMRMRLTVVPVPDTAKAQAAFLGGFCDALTSDLSWLAGFRHSLGSRAREFALMGEVISKEPLSIVVRRDDWRFFEIVRWTHFAMLAAEELNLDREVVRQMQARSEAELATAGIEAQRLLGRVGASGRMLGLDADWPARLVLQVGNYREVWERNIGPLGIRRGLNLLWNQGGLHYAPPMR